MQRCAVVDGCGCGVVVCLVVLAIDQQHSQANDSSVLSQHRCAVAAIQSAVRSQSGAPRSDASILDDVRRDRWRRRCVWQLAHAAALSNAFARSRECRSQGSGENAWCAVRLDSGDVRRSAVWLRVLFDRVVLSPRRVGVAFVVVSCRCMRACEWTCTETRQRPVRTRPATPTWTRAGSSCAKPSLASIAMASPSPSTAVESAGAQTPRACLVHSLTHSFTHSLSAASQSLSFRSFCCVSRSPVQSNLLLFITAVLAVVVVVVAVRVQLRRYTAVVEGLCGCHEHRSQSPSLPSSRTMASRLLHQLSGIEGAPLLK
jgi:hypothetical protein